MRKLWKIFRHAAGASLLLAALLWPAQPAISYAAEAPTITMSLEDFNRLEQNYKVLQTALEESLIALEEAKKLLTASDEDLNELQESLTSSRQKISQLQTELQMQKEMSKLLCSELTQLQTESVTLEQQLKKAEEFLNATEKAYQRERKINKRQTRLWQVIAVVAAGIAATR